MSILQNFVDLFLVLSYFQTKEQKFSSLRRNYTFLALTNGTFKSNNKHTRSAWKQEKIYFPVLKFCYSCLSRLRNLPMQLNWSSAVKVKAQTKSRHKYSEALLPQMSYIASKILHSLRGLSNNPHNMATGHRYLGTNTWQRSWWLKELPAHITAERFLKVFERLLLRLLEPVFDPQLSDKPAGFMHC